MQIFEYPENQIIIEIYLAENMESRGYNEYIYCFLICPFEMTKIDDFEIKAKQIAFSIIFMS